MSTPHKATPEQWAQIEKFVSDYGYNSCLIELRARVEALEREAAMTELRAASADARPAPASSLVERVATTLRQLQVDSPWIPRHDSEARAAIREVATWLKQEGIEAWAADRLLEEVNRA